MTIDPLAAWAIALAVVALVVVTAFQSLQMNRLTRFLKQSQEETRTTVQTTVKEAVVVSRAALPGHDLDALATRATQSVKELSQAAASMVDAARKKADALASYAKNTLATVRDEDGRTKQSARTTVEEAEKTLQKLDEAEKELAGILGEPTSAAQPARLTTVGASGNARTEEVGKAKGSGDPKHEEKPAPKPREAALTDN